jgi:hypothetical protein
MNNNIYWNTIGYRLRNFNTIKNIEKGIDEHCNGIKYYNETFKNK